MPLDKQELAEIENVYNLFDTAGTGAVPASELGVLLRSAGEAPTEKKVKELMGDATTITLQDVIAAVETCRVECPRPSLTQLENAFLTLDKSGTGLIEIDRLKEFLTTTGEPLSEVELQDVMKHVAVRPDGKVDCAKLAKLLAA